MEETESEKQHRVWFCVIQYIATDMSVCCRSVDEGDIKRRIAR